MDPCAFRRCSWFQSDLFSTCDVAKGSFGRRVEFHLKRREFLGEAVQQCPARRLGGPGVALGLSDSLLKGLDFIVEPRPVFCETVESVLKIGAHAGFELPFQLFVDFGALLVYRMSPFQQDAYLKNLVDAAFVHAFLE